jgi:hypothetical protein
MTGDSLAHHLDRQVERSHDFFWHRVRWYAVRSQLPRDRPFKLVDVGAGVGLLGEYLHEEFPWADYAFTEPIPALEQRLEARWGATANVWNEARFTGADVVTLLDVAEHIEDDRAFLRELVDKMPVQSRLVMTVPALQSLWSHWDVALGHFRRYDKAMVREVFAPLPVDLLEVSYLFPEMLPAAVVRRRSTREADDEAAEFPDLPSPVNRVLEAVGTGTMRMRHLWPRGTSVFVVARRR